MYYNPGHQTGKSNHQKHKGRISDKKVACIAQPRITPQSPNFWLRTKHICQSNLAQIFQISMIYAFNERLQSVHYQYQAKSRILRNLSQIQTTDFGPQNEKKRKKSEFNIKPPLPHGEVVLRCPKKIQFNKFSHCVVGSRESVLVLQPVFWCKKAILSQCQKQPKSAAFLTRILEESQRHRVKPTGRVGISQQT